MLYFDVPKRPAPAELVRAFKEAPDDKARTVAQKALANFDATVGHTRVAVPLEVQQGGPEALEQFQFHCQEEQWRRVDAAVVEE